MEMINVTGKLNVAIPTLHLPWDQWDLDNITKIKFLSAMCKQNGSQVSNMNQAAIVCPVERHGLDSLLKYN